MESQEVVTTESSSTANIEVPQEPQVVPIAIPDVTAQPLPAEGASTQEVSPWAIQPESIDTKKMVSIHSPEDVNKPKEPVQEAVQDKVQVEEKPKAPVYRDLSEEEQGMLLAQYDKHNGVISSLILDEDCLFHGKNQVAYYVDKYGFQGELGRIREQRAKEVVAGLHDSKILAVRRAQELLSPRHKVLMTKGGIEIFDEDGKPVIIELYPHYKEIVAAWEIIKVELGEPTTISKGDITTGGEKLNTGAKELATVLQDILHDKPKPALTEEKTSDTPNS